MRRRVVAAGAMGLAVLVLSGCGADVPGDVARSDRFRIAQQQVADDVAAVLEALGQPPGEPPAGWAIANVERLVRNAVVSELATDLGVRVSAGDVRTARDELAEGSFGSADALLQAALQSGIPPDGIDGVIRMSLELEAIGRELAPDAGAAEQQAAAQAALVELSDEIDLEVAPRYGTWDAAAGGIEPGSPVAATSTLEPVAP